jgi:hypothetical protein
VIIEHGYPGIHVCVDKNVAMNKQFYYSSTFYCKKNQVDEPARLLLIAHVGLYSRSIYVERSFVEESCRISPGVY